MSHSFKAMLGSLTAAFMLTIGAGAANLALPTSAEARENCCQKAKPRQAARKKKQRAAPALPAASLAMDMETGDVLVEERKHERIQPASLTKMMTLLLLFEALDKPGTSLKLDSRIQVSARAAREPWSKHTPVSAGDSFTIEQAILSQTVRSHNKIAVAIAEKVGGTESRFVEAMNRKAQQLGMTNTRFTNASGNPDPQQRTTVYDMALLARHVHKNYPHYYHYFSESSVVLNGRTYGPHMNSARTLSTANVQVDGKSGYISRHSNVLGIASHNARQIIVVVLRGRNCDSRNAIATNVMDKAFRSIGMPVTIPNPVPGCRAAAAQKFGPGVTSEESMGDVREEPETNEEDSVPETETPEKKPENGSPAAPVPRPS